MIRKIGKAVRARVQTMSELQAGLCFIFAASAITLLAASPFMQQGWT